MRVLMVSPYSLTRPGGVQGQVLGLARELRRIGVDVRVLGPCDGPPPAPGVWSVGPTVGWEQNGSIAPIAPGPEVARRTLDALNHLRPDVVHLHEPLVPGPAVTLLLGCDRPMIGTHHISGEIGREWLMPAARATVGRLRWRVAVSESAAATATAAFGGEYEVLWNGIEVDRFAAAEPWPTTRPAVFFCNRHEPRKGLRVLLDAWRGIERDAVLWVGSGGPQTAELKARGDAGVEWLGPLTDHERNRRLRAATVYCAPSTGGESFGVALLEPMAAGTALVASDIDGYRNVARHDVDSVLVAPEDPDALRVALRTLLDDAPARARLVAGGRERAEQFSMARLAERYRDIYARVAGEQTP